jgi:hypothetical protein
MKRWIKYEERDNPNVTKRYKEAGGGAVRNRLVLRGDAYTYRIDYLFTLRGDHPPPTNFFISKRGETEISFWSVSFSLTQVGAHAWQQMKGRRRSHPLKQYKKTQRSDGESSVAFSSRTTSKTT